jgi:non-canonical purine NTP pyrophosphatase (RdgB/HAM1 family)
MKEVFYVTGNPHKAEYFSKIMEIEIPQINVDVEEVQSLNVRYIVEQKAKQAYALVKKPVIVEDTKLTFRALGALPGPLIKWFLEELGAEGLCRLLDGYDDRTAMAGAATAYFDGHTLRIFEREILGTIAVTPKGVDGFGWNKIFIPEGASMTLAEMDDDIFIAYYRKIKPFDELKIFLEEA